MTNDTRKPREFWLIKGDEYEYIGNSSKIDNIEDTAQLHVIEYSAYEDAVDAVKYNNHGYELALKALRKERDEYRAVLKEVGTHWGEIGRAHV